MRKIKNAEESQMRSRITIGLWLVTLSVALAACGSSDGVATGPVTPDPERPTFILFFTDL
jgi:hypothetical protein